MAGLTTTLLAGIREVLGSNLGRDINYLERGFSGFPQSNQENPGIVLQRVHDRLLPDPFQNIVHSTLHSLATERVLK
jgi:hypothetical protein